MFGRKGRDGASPNRLSDYAFGKCRVRAVAVEVVFPRVTRLRAGLTTPRRRLLDARAVDDPRITCDARSAQGWAAHSPAGRLALASREFSESSSLDDYSPTAPARLPCAPPRLHGHNPGHVRSSAFRGVRSGVSCPNDQGRAE